VSASHPVTLADMVAAPPQSPRSRISAKVAIENNLEKRAREMYEEEDNSGTRLWGELDATLKDEYRRLARKELINESLLRDMGVA
jgi:hypothetical protein